MNVADVHARGTLTIGTIYGPSLLPKIFSSFGAHSADIQFMELFSVYGLYLSDFEVLSPLETELVVFTAISCTGLRGPSLWHMRGLGRLLGARGNDENTEKMNRIKDSLRSVKVGVMSVVDWVDGPGGANEEMARKVRMSNWVNVGDVVRELGGWGDDA